MREIFRSAAISDPGRVFYTITDDNIGKRIIGTEIGVIYLGDVIGYVQPDDVGKRLYRVPNEAQDHWLWQCESNSQRDARLAKTGSRS